MKNKIEITRKQLDVIGDFLLEVESLIASMIENGQSGPPAEEAKRNRGLCKKYQGFYWWNDTLRVHQQANKTGDVFAKLHERMNQNDA